MDGIISTRCLCRLILSRLSLSPKGEIDFLQEFTIKLSKSSKQHQGCLREANLRRSALTVNGSSPFLAKISPFVVRPQKTRANGHFPSPYPVFKVLSSKVFDRFLPAGFAVSVSTPGFLQPYSQDSGVELDYNGGLGKSAFVACSGTEGLSQRESGP